MQPPAPADETLLVVDDEKSVRDFMGLSLAYHGYEVLKAGHGAEALDLAGRYPGPIRLLITDVVMPGMNGRELAERLAEARPGTRVLFISGYSDDIILRYGLFQGSVEFLPKPFSAASLLHRVRRMLAEPSLRRAG